MDIRVTQYIENSAPFAQEILDYLRETVHSYCPEIEETIKWNFPVFLYKGKILCNMAAFKNHCSFGFWLAPIMKSSQFKSDGMGDLGKIKQLQDLPEIAVLAEMILEAMSLTEEGKTLPSKAKATIEFEVPTEIDAFISENPQAKLAFMKFSPSHKKEYIQWILEAKTEKTKQKRIFKMMENLESGKSLNWKYSK